MVMPTITSTFTTSFIIGFVYGFVSATKQDYDERVRETWLNSIPTRETKGAQMDLMTFEVQKGTEDNLVITYSKTPRKK